MAADGAWFEETCEQNLLALPDEIRAYIPQRDSWALAEDTRQEFMRRESRRRRRLATLLASGKDLDSGSSLPVLKPHEILERRRAFKLACAHDPIFAIENCIFTRDPERKVRAGRSLPLMVFGYARDQMFSHWLAGLEDIDYRLCLRKSRRMLLSIYRMAFELMCFRFTGSSFAWVSSDKEGKIDKGNDWNSLFGKFRYMWKCARTYYPWLFPELPAHTKFNQVMQLRMPEMYDEAGNPLDEEVWNNELIGVLPADPRSGAATRGFADEAGYIAEINKLLDAAEDMTPDLCLGSTAPEDPGHPFWKRSELPGVKTEIIPWHRNPLNLENIHWDHEGEWRGPHTKRWRSKVYAKALSTRPSNEVGRNWDIDPASTAGARVLQNFDNARNCMPKDPMHPGWDLYEPQYPTVVWYDVGRGDPWSFIWLQIKDDIGCVDVVDYWMREDVTAHWWVPLLLGWPYERRSLWVTAPEAMPWDKAVPWTYNDDEQAIMRRWLSRRRDRGGHVSWMYGDFFGTKRGQTDLYTVEERFYRYGLQCSSEPAQWQMDKLTEHADEVVLRTRISGFLVDKRPGDRWPAINEALYFWRRGKQLPTTGRKAMPLHDDNSHTGQAFVFGAKWLPAQVKGRIMEGRKRVVIPPRANPMQVQRAETGWWI